MSIYISNNYGVSSMYVNVGGDMREVSGAFVNRNGSPAKVFSKGPAPLDIVTWGGGTDKQIARMLEGHYNGEINIHDYWNVGDERVVQLQASSGDSAARSLMEQNVTMVLMHSGGKTLTAPINGHSECAFIVGQKEVVKHERTLNDYDFSMDWSGNDTSLGIAWNSCSMRTWCNTVYRNAIPTSLRLIFKEHINVSSTDSTSSGISKPYRSNDYFALASEKEIYGSCSYANSTAESQNGRFTYYKTAGNLGKHPFTSYVPNRYWTRSNISNSINFCCVDFTQNNSGATTYLRKSRSRTSTGGISPFGVI